MFSIFLMLFDNSAVQTMQTMKKVAGIFKNIC